MKIAQIAPPWLAVPPKGYGGIEWVVALLADGLAERGHEVTLFATGDSVTKAKLEYVYEHAPGSGAILSPWSDTAHTLRAFRDADAFDVVHVHTPFSQVVAGAACAKPVVHTVHGEFNEASRAIYSQIPDAMTYVAISEAQRAFMPELSYGGVVYNGIDPARYPLRETKEDFLLFLGRTAPMKGLRRAVETARLTGDRLVIAVKAANALERNELESVSELFPNNIEVLGEISHEEKADLLGRAKAVLFPIDWPEPFGLVMTEANACGTPVIATPRGSVPEVVQEGENGWIVPVEGYAEAAAEKLQLLDQIDPVACRARVLECFSQDAMVTGYEKIYQDIV